MNQSLDEYVVGALGTGSLPEPPHRAGVADVAALQALFEAQVQSRHLDLAQRWLQAQGQGFYTIGSAGHESNAAVAMALRPSDPALLHYRSGAFYCARARVGTRLPAGRRRRVQLRRRVGQPLDDRGRAQRGRLLRAPRPADADPLRL